jgi:hypothetical protein
MDASSMDEMFVHEYGHTIQSRLTGPLYLPMVGVPSLIGSILDIGIGTDLGHNGAIGLLLRNGGLHNHNDEWNEIQANRLSYSYFGNFRKNDYDKMQWENEEYKREYVYDWYFRLTNPHAFMWWLEF